jgi:hypothetical protein
MNKASKSYAVWSFSPTEKDLFPEIHWPYPQKPREDDILALTNLHRIERKLVRLVNPPEGTLTQSYTTDPLQDCLLIPRTKLGQLSHWWCFMVFGFRQVPPMGGWCKDHPDMQAQWLEHARPYGWTSDVAPVQHWRYRIVTVNVPIHLPKPSKRMPFDMMQGPVYYSELCYAALAGWRSRTYHKSVVKMNALVEFNEAFGLQHKRLPKYTTFKPDNSLTALRQYYKIIGEPQPQTEQ